MMNVLNRLPIALRAFFELGPARAFWYAVYQAGLRSGHYRRGTPITAWTELSGGLRSPFKRPARVDLEAVPGNRIAALIEEAEEIAAGKIRLFGGATAPLILIPPDAKKHWSAYEGRPERWGVEDIKFVWEPARFGWAYTLGRAYCASGDERYALQFWEYFETFRKENPPNQGPNWLSGQEVALRLMALLFARSAFEQSPHTTRQRLACLAGAVAIHAARIAQTLSYARAQNNNHRISEALGLYAAGWALPEHPQARPWQSLGWHELNRALQSQIERDGNYTQHSMNYHRLMLHAALLGALFDRAYPPLTMERLAAAALWLIAQVDRNTGLAPNLGSNDGANILPLAQTSFADFRPAAQAAARAFLGRPAFPPGPWDEAGLWLGQEMEDKAPPHSLPTSPAVHLLDSPKSASWGTLRAVHFRGRPSHADQLHVDLWWQGENIAMDAGTFRYTAGAPWDNTLAQTFVHNTVEVNGQSQMQRAGRFLWLRWAQAKMLPVNNLASTRHAMLCAQHDGYCRLGVLHQRLLQQVTGSQWHVVDYLMPCQAGRNTPVYPYRLNWLLPDWPWTLKGTTLTLTRPAGGSLHLAISAQHTTSSPAKIEEISLARAGTALAGPPNVSPIRGWFSPTYNEKVPALSFSIVVRAPLPLTLFSDWTLTP